MEMNHRWYTVKIPLNKCKLIMLASNGNIYHLACFVVIDSATTYDYENLNMIMCNSSIDELTAIELLESIDRFVSLLVTFKINRKSIVAVLDFFLVY